MVSSLEELYGEVDNLSSFIHPKYKKRFKGLKLLHSGQHHPIGAFPLTEHFSRFSQSHELHIFIPQNRLLNQHFFRLCNYFLSTNYYF